MEVKQETQKKYHDRLTKARAFNEGDPVFVRNTFTGSGSAWLLGNITRIRGPVSYTVKLNDGRMVRKCVNITMQIRFRTITVHEPAADTLDNFLPPSSPNSNNDNNHETALPPRRSSRIRRSPQPKVANRVLTQLSSCNHVHEL